MRESMAQLTGPFSANRAVRQYTEEHYLPAAAAYRQRAADQGAAGRQFVNWQQLLEQKWPMLGFGALKVSSDPNMHRFEIPVYLGSLDPDSIRVELYADGIAGSDAQRHAMTRGPQSADANGAIYSTQIPAARPAADYTVRIIPRCDGVAVPLEVNLILWQQK